MSSETNTLGVKKIIYIKWMHCISCEIVLEKELKDISWANLIIIDHKKWIMEVDFKKKSAYNKLVNVIEKAWFTVIEKWEKKNNNIDSNMLLNIIAIFVVIILFLFTKLFNLYSFLPDISTLSYSSAFLVWIIASISTCLAITGWIIIWFSRYIDSSKSTLRHIKVQIWFQIWRIVWFFLLWWLLWYIWEVFSFSLSINWVITFLVWFILLYMWLNILKILPSLSRFWIYMPKSFVSKIEILWKPKFAPIVWALTFFLPCWFTQTMQLLAVSSSSFWIGWFVMLFFALWTAPVLFSVWVWSSYFKDKNFIILNKVIWVIVIFFWIFTITNSYNLLQINSISADNNEIVWEIQENTNLEIVNVSHNGWQTKPSIIELKKWWDYKLIITPTSDWLGCMSTQTIPKISSQISYIKKGVPIEYEIRNAKSWIYNIVCTSMWMVQWQILIK